MATVGWEEEDDWELVNDDGFVYKRKKRPRLDPTSTSAPPAPDPAAEERNRRERKKRVLTRLKDKYEKEIYQWEQLSNTLKALQENAQNQLQQQEITTTTTGESSQPAKSSEDPGTHRVVDDLLVRVEAEEAIIQDVSNLCDIAEAICDIEDERVKQSLFDLPLWGSPRELMACLGDQKNSSS